jgi:DNA-binding CsgD family transcriptional regulator
MSASSSGSALEKRRVASIRRLCCLGLGSQILVPALLRELHTLIPSFSNQFFWAGPDLELANIYDEGDTLLPLLPFYLSELHNKSEKEVVATFAETMRKSKNSMVMRYRERTVKVDQRTFEKHDFYNLTMRPSELDDALQLKVSAHGCHLGLLHISRRRSDPQFRDRDLALLEWIAPFVAHAFDSACQGGELTESDDRGLIIATTAGRIEYLSPRADRLLMMAQHPVLLSAGARLPQAGTSLPPELTRLCGALAGVFGDKAQATVPAGQLTSPWGVFTFRVYWLDHAAGAGASPLIGMTVERLEPLSLKLWRHASELPLTGREIEVLELLARGRPRAEIASRLGVHENTAINHCRNLYAKLGVHSRAELVELLHGGQRSVPRRE